jgi:hypothetical protein
MSAYQQAKALHTIKKAYRKGLHKKVLHRSRLGSQAAGQDFYIIKIHLTTSKTGKRTIEFTPRMLESPEGDQAWVPRQHPDQFRIARTPNVAPYAQKPIKGKNKEWDTLNKNIKKLLDAIFKPGHDVRLFNPLYPNNRSKDMIFQITTYRWKTRPHSSKLGNYKFVIDKNNRDELVVNINVKLEGKMIKGEHKVRAPIPQLPPPKTFGERIDRACDKHRKAVRDLVNSYYESGKFEKTFQRGEAERAAYHTRGRNPFHRRRRRLTALVRRNRAIVAWRRGGRVGPQPTLNDFAHPGPTPSPWKGGGRRQTRRRRRRKTRRHRCQRHRTRRRRRRKTQRT